MNRYKCETCEGQNCTWCLGLFTVGASKAYSHVFCDIFDLVEKQRHMYLSGLKTGDTEKFIQKLKLLTDRAKEYAKDVEVFDK